MTQANARSHHTIPTLTNSVSIDHISAVTVTAVLKCVIPNPDSVHVGSRVLKYCDVRQ